MYIYIYIYISSSPANAEYLENGRFYFIENLQPKNQNYIKQKVKKIIFERKYFLSSS